MQNMGGGYDAAAIVPGAIIVVTAPHCCPTSSPSRRPVCVGVPAPMVVVVTVPLAVISMQLLFCLLPS